MLKDLYFVFFVTCVKSFASKKNVSIKICCHLSCSKMKKTSATVDLEIITFPAELTYICVWKKNLLNKWVDRGFFFVASRDKVRPSKLTANYSLLQLLKKAVKIESTKH